MPGCDEYELWPLYIEKVKIWSGVTDAWQLTDRLWKIELLSSLKLGVGVELLYLNIRYEQCSLSMPTLLIIRKYSKKKAWVSRKSPSCCESRSEWSCRCSTTAGGAVNSRWTRSLRKILRQHKHKHKAWGTQMKTQNLRSASWKPKHNPELWEKTYSLRETQRECKVLG